MKAPKKRSSGTSASNQQPREIELKLELASGGSDVLLEHPALAHAHPLPDQSGHLHAVYYDTDDRALRRAGVSLRIRSKNGRAIQTVKAESGERGLTMDRGEWETPVDDALDFAAIAETPLGSLLPDEAARKAIKPLFTVETERKAFEIEHDGAVIEMALDQAEASAAGRSLPFSEVELELKQGEASALFALARALSETASLRLALVAKSERGYRLLEDGSICSFKAEKITLPQDASCAAAFRIIGRNCLSQMMLNEALVRQTQNPAALHQMRVGLRRLRAAISLFKSQLLADGESAEIRDALRCAGQPLGEARDLDVLLERLRAADEAGHDSSDLHDSSDRHVSSDPHVSSDLEEIEQRRSQAYRNLLDTLESPRFMDVVLRTAAWIEAGAWSIGHEGGQKKALKRPARDFAGTELSRRWRRIRKLARHMRDVDDAERHELRIRIKKLRYGAEFFGSLFASDKAQKRRKKLLEPLEDLQELLGELNDLAVHGSLVPSLSTLSPESIDRRRNKLLDKAEAAAAKLDEAKPFWM
ncbi:CYTH and CHAD domain-containing protein [Microvirga vignae]|uniref:CYTH and CHAD domain-containing protein n=1 Tax=Microvirga vignae TaxID=1225564 RepID=UPI0006992BF4|nr:CYTH and CHAD domain-containing protein [Microvirga vignae]